MSGPGRVGARLASWGWDYLVVVAGLALFFVVVGLPQLLGWWDLSGIWVNQWAADVAITVLTVVPYLIYLVVSEAQDPHATWGKLKAGLRVVGRDGGPPRLSQVVTRDMIKVLPWQFGHMGAVRLINTSGADPAGTWLAIASMVVLVLIVAPILIGKAGIHDLWGGTRVAAVVSEPRVRGKGSPRPRRGSRPTLRR
ncbi:MAG: RDD family protein [Acidimicrobiia bacterium]